MRDAPPGYRLSFDHDELQLDVIHAFLAASHWSPGIPRAVVETAARHSLVVGAYAGGGAQVGYARLVTDRATFAWLADVFVLPPHRGRGLSLAMVGSLMDLPEARGMRRLLLSTRDAHGVYERLGWARVEDASRLMQVYRPDVYRAG